MTILCDDFVVAIKSANCEDKRLFVKDFDNQCYYTNDFPDNFAAYNAMIKLAVEGYVRVRMLYPV